jgi:hypothetical protein
MATEMIEGAEYIWNGERFTFCFPHTRWSRFGWYRDVRGYLYAIRMDALEPVLKLTQPTPFPEPERWQAKDQYVNVNSTREFTAQHEYAAASIVEQHNAEIGRLMGEIRRLEALVQK